MRDLQRLANERYEEEERLQAKLKQAVAEAQQDLSDKQQAINEEWEETRKLAEDRFEKDHNAESSSYDTGRKSMQGEYQGLRSDVESQHASETKNALLHQQETAWETWAMFDATKDGPQASNARGLQPLVAKPARIGSAATRRRGYYENAKHEVTRLVG